MAIQTVGLLSPGDMGHIVGQVLLQHGMRVVTCLQGRSERTCMLSRQAGIAEVPTYEQLVREADLLLDVRYLPNPHYREDLRPLTGRDQRVVEYVEAGDIAAEFYERLFPLLDFVLPAYVTEGKTHLTIAIGCTGGKHRSVTVADRIARHLAGRDDVSMRVVHRDVELD